MNKSVLLLGAMIGVLFSCGKSACECKKESDNLTSKSLREKLSGGHNESEEKLKELDKECAEFTFEDYKECK